MPLDSHSVLVSRYPSIHVPNSRLENYIRPPMGWDHDKQVVRQGFPFEGVNLPFRRVHRFDVEEGYNLDFSLSKAWIHNLGHGFRRIRSRVWSKERHLNLVSDTAVPQIVIQQEGCFIRGWRTLVGDSR